MLPPQSLQSQDLPKVMLKLKLMICQDICVYFSDRYITDKFLPDKAIDVIDEVGASRMLLPKNKRRKKVTVKRKKKASLEYAAPPTLKESKLGSFHGKFRASPIVAGGDFREDDHDHRGSHFFGNV